MPDEAKFHTLDRINWHEQSVCGLCTYFRGRPGAWGHCRAFSYKHAKHGHRPLGVHAYGTCDKFERAAARAEKMLQSYAGRDT